MGSDALVKAETLVNPTYEVVKHPEGKRIQSFKEFYPFYLGEHRNVTNRRLHIVGTTFVVMTLLRAIYKRSGSTLAMIPIFGYGMAWIGHFAFEKNRPATFKYPLWSLMGDFRMWFEVVSFKRRI
ncbi:hypothetical protein HDU97_008980 [Phlyctochytrium planicorne]|nr:hypothetical protein HDU97_008980 [Phlyctochytrium planicorne]